MTIAKGKGKFIRRKSRPAAGVGFTAAAVLAAAVPVIAPHEGLRTSPYLDIVGVPTVCYGDTTVAMRDYTRAECDAMLEDRIREFGARLNACVPATDAIPPAAAVAILSWSYNVGTGAACGSTLVRKLNAGDLVGACNELPKWNKAGGKVSRGLTNRRAAEQRLCLDAAAGTIEIEPPAPPAPWWIPSFLAGWLGYSTEV